MSSNKRRMEEQDHDEPTPQDFLDCLDFDEAANDDDLNELNSLFGGTKSLTQEELEALAAAAPTAQAAQQPEKEQGEKERSEVRPAPAQAPTIQQQAIQQGAEPPTHKQCRPVSPDHHYWEDEIEERPKKRRSLDHLSSGMAFMTVDSDSSDDEDDNNERQRKEKKAQRAQARRRKTPQSRKRSSSKGGSSRQRSKSCPPSSSRLARQEHQPQQQPQQGQNESFASQYQRMLDKLAMSMQKSEESRCRLNGMDCSEAQEHARRQMRMQQEHGRRMAAMQAQQQQRRMSMQQQMGMQNQQQMHQQQGNASASASAEGGGSFQAQYKRFLGRLTDTMKMSERSRICVDYGHPGEGARRNSGMFPPMGRLM